jgi:1-acyl-sn-glycerol-3-phosphate acyltransferase
VKLHYRLGWLVMRGVARLLWGYRARGGARIPANGPVVIASNHISNWDPILIGLGCRREVYFLAKEELFRNRPFAALIRAYNALPVRRGGLDRRALKLAGEVLERGGVLVMFPEGTRGRPGAIGKAKPGAAYLASRAGAPIVPTYLTGSDRLWRALRRESALRVIYGEPIGTAGAGAREDYEALTARVMDSVRRLSAEVEGT